MPSLAVFYPRFEPLNQTARSEGKPHLHATAKDCRPPPRLVRQEQAEGEDLRPSWER